MQPLFVSVIPRVFQLRPRQALKQIIVKITGKFLVIVFMRFLSSINFESVYLFFNKVIKSIKELSFVFIIFSSYFCFFLPGVSIT